MTVTLSDWLFRAVLAKSVLTLSRDYFRLRKPLERRIYELARKHCGRQPRWQVSVGTLHKKSGSTAPVRVFRAALRKMLVPLQSAAAITAFSVAPTETTGKSNSPPGRPPSGAIAFT